MSFLTTMIKSTIWNYRLHPSVGRGFIRRRFYERHKIRKHIMYQSGLFHDVFIIKKKLLSLKGQLRYFLKKMAL